jgi:hypothetical protein
MHCSVSMSFIADWFSSALWTPASQALKDAYNVNLAERVSYLYGRVTGPFKARITELENTPGVSASTIVSLKNLTNNALTIAKNPSTSLTAVSDAIPAFTAQFNLLNEEAKLQAAIWQQQQLDESKVASEKEVADQKFNIYRLMGTIKDTFIKFIWWIILAVVALFGGSVMSNRAFNKAIGFRIYYFIYGTLLFPLSYIVLIKNMITYFTTEDSEIQEDSKVVFYSILAPLLNRANHRIFINVLFFPFVFNKPAE